MKWGFKTFSVFSSTWHILILLSYSRNILSSFCRMIRTRRFYLTGDMTNLYPFIQGWLEWPFSELFSANVSLWNQYKYIAFNIFSCRILIISYKMLIITRISNEETNELTIYEILCWNVTVFYRQELVFLFQLQEKLKTCRSSKWNFSSRCFIADDSHTKIVWLHIIVFSEHDILHFWDNVHLFKYYQWKYLKIALILSIAQIKPVYKFPNFRLH